MLKEMEYILAVAEEGSISKASERLYVGQPAISKVIASVEEDLGIKLFARERTGMVLTEAGKLYIAYVERVRAIETEMYQRFVSAEQMKLNIAMTLNTSSLSASMINQEIAGQIPGYDLQIDNVLSKDVLSLLRQKQYQYAVCPERILVGQGDIQCEPLFTNGWLYITPRNVFPNVSGYVEPVFGDLWIDAEGILRQPLILQEDSTNIRKEINELLDLSGRPSFREKMEVANSLLAIEAVQDGLGCAIISDSFRVYVNKMRVNIYRIETDKKVMTVLAYMKGRKIPPKEKSCIRIMGRILAERNNTLIL